MLGINWAGRRDFDERKVFDSIAVNIDYSLTPDTAVLLNEKTGQYVVIFNIGPPED